MSKLVWVPFKIQDSSTDNIRSTKYNYAKYLDFNWH